MTGKQSFWAALCRWGIPAAVIAAPLSLLGTLHATFNPDWTNNIWMADYARAYFNAHGRMPATYDVAGHVGITQPIFYGPLLYPWLGLMSEPFGAVAGVRLACLFLWTLQFLLVYRLGRAVSGSAPKSAAAAAIVSWSVYSLTNLYNRGALAEFFGSGFLLCAVAAGGLSLIEQGRLRKAGLAILTGVCAAMSFGSHGPTALLGGFLLLLLGIAAIPMRVGIEMAGVRHGGARRLGAMILVALGVALAVSPWVYAAGEMFGKLAIETPGYKWFPSERGWQRYPSIDSAWARLKPLPMEDRWTVEKYPEWITPHLDAEWNFPLALLAAWNVALVVMGWREEWIYRSVRPLLICAGVAGLGLLAVSISTALQGLLPMWVGGIIQFPYRLVSEVNIAMFVVLMAAWAARGGERLSDGGRALSRGLAFTDGAVVAAVLLLAGLSLAIKIDHAASVMVTPDLWATQGSDELLRTLPSTFVGERDYTVQAADRVVDRATTVAAPAAGGPTIQIRDADEMISSRQYVATSILNFPWNRLVLDGNEIPFEQVGNASGQQAVVVEAGRHTIGYRFEPEGMWVVLRRISWTILIGGAAASIICLAFGGNKKNSVD